MTTIQHRPDFVDITQAQPHLMDYLGLLIRDNWSEKGATGHIYGVMHLAAMVKQTNNLPMLIDAFDRIIGGKRSMLHVFCNPPIRIDSPLYQEIEDAILRLLAPHPETGQPMADPNQLDLETAHLPVLLAMSTASIPVVEALFHAGAEFSTGEFIALRKRLQVQGLGTARACKYLHRMFAALAEQPFEPIEDATLFWGRTLSDTVKSGIDTDNNAHLIRILALARAILSSDDFGTIASLFERDDPHHRTLLHIFCSAVYSRHSLFDVIIDAVKKLVTEPALSGTFAIDIDKIDSKTNETALVRAMHHGNNKLVELLLEAGANPDIINPVTGSSAVDIAGHTGFRQMFEAQRARRAMAAVTAGMAPARKVT